MTAFILTCILSLFTKAQQADSIITITAPGSSNSMKLFGNGSFMVTGNYDGGTFATDPPVNGGGTRLMWFPDRAAFRVGYVDNFQWDGTFTGYFSVAMGRNCYAGNSVTFAMGDQCSANGNTSFALGYHAHTNARQGSFVFADKSIDDTLRAGVNHSATWRVSGGFRIFTSSNLSTGVTIQSGASVSNWGQSNAVISTSTGAYLGTNGVWNSVSDVNKKHLFQNISGENVLRRLRSIPIQEWTYKAEDDNVRHIGPTAQDFKKAFGLGTDDRTIGSVDADGVALAGIQALDNRTTQQQKRIAALEKENKELKQRLERLERLLIRE